MKFKSEYFKDAGELVEGKDLAWKPVAIRRKRLKLVRQFTNMLPTLTEDEMEELGRTEAANFGLAYNAMLQNETLFTSMVSGTNALLEIIVDTDNPELDVDLGLRLSEAINRGVIHRKGRFLNFWKKCGGEITIAGGGPVTFPEQYGCMPELRLDMFFPVETDLDSDKIPYSFEPVNLTMSDLKKLRKSVTGKEGTFHDVKEIDALIESLKAQIKDHQQATSSTHHETSRSVRDEDHFDSVAKIPAWRYYEVKYAEESGEPHVSSTLFTDGFVYIGDRKLPTKRNERGVPEDGRARIITYIDKAYDSPSDWLQLVCVDSEIGGVKNLDTLRGVAELVYPSSLEIEELLNLVLEGDKMRSKPRYQVEDAADEDKALAWNVILDSFVPRGVTEMEHKTNAQNLLTPFGMLQGNLARLTSGSVSNSGRDGELRQQAVERQENSAAIVASRSAEGYIHLDSILETLVWRVLAGEVKPGTDGYNDIMWVRDRLKQYKIDFEKLAGRKFGRFQFLKVRAKRMTGNGNRDQQIATAEWLLKNLQNYPPASRPLILRIATALYTGDPDLAEAVVTVPKAIINAQKITAENERDTIRARAPLGQVLPVMPEDIGQDHVPIHILDMQGALARHEARPWDRLDVLEFAGLAEHTGEHVQIMLANPVSNMEAKVLMRDYQMVVQAAQAIVKEVQEKEGTEQTQLTGKEQAELELKWSVEQRKQVELGIKVAGNEELYKDREARRMLSTRNQYAKEVAEDRRLALGEKQLEVQRQAGDTKPKQ